MFSTKHFGCVLRVWGQSVIILGEFHRDLTTKTPQNMIYHWGVFPKMTPTAEFMEMATL